MSACSQCGTVVKPGDKFCNVCGTPIRPGIGGGPTGGHAAPAAPTYGSQGAPPPMPFGGPTAASPGQPGYGAPAPQAPRCQLGHEIAPGASYCAQGHPIALDQMQFANDPYGLNNYGQPPPAPPGMGGGRPPSAYGTPPPPGYGAPPPPPYNAPPPPAAYASAYGAPMQQPGGSAPPNAMQYAPPQQYGNPAGAPPAPAYTAEPPAKVLRGFLVAYGTNASGDFWPLTGGRLTVGRFGTGDGLDIPLQDPTISSRHATMVVDAATGAVNVEDTGSTNGTFVNDEHIGYGGRRELRDGDRIRFGGFTTIVKVIGRV
jgi:hypothetical protein